MFSQRSFLPKIQVSNATVFYWWSHFSIISILVHIFYEIFATAMSQIMSRQTYFYILLFTTFLIRAHILISTKYRPSNGSINFDWCLFETQKICGSDASEFQTKTIIHSIVPLKTAFSFHQKYACYSSSFIHLIYVLFLTHSTVTCITHL
jgi:hypothetical protein